MTSTPPESSAPDPRLLETLCAIIWEADPVTFQFLYVSRAAEALLGFSLEDWLSRPTFWVDLLHPDDRDKAVATCRAAVDERRDHDFEYRVIASDGSIRWMRDIVSVRTDANGRVDCLCGLMVDLTDAKLRLEQALRRADRVEAIARITSAVAHDLRNVFGVVRGNVDLALERDTGTLQHELTEIREAATLGNAIIEQLSTFDRRHRRLTVVDVNETVHDIRAFLERLIRPTAELVVETSATRPHVVANSGAVPQILLNLVVNAKEAIVDSPGHILIATRNVRTSVPGNPHVLRDLVEIEVSDTGTGIPPHVGERIFELHFSTKDERRGGGIGLATVATIVRDVGGTISFESEPLRGSTFRVRLPLGVVGR
jgi:two-component system cell cycle sensor histidine kinase/response regulator CckA